MTSGIRDVRLVMSPMSGTTRVYIKNKGSCSPSLLTYKPPVASNMNVYN